MWGDTCFVCYLVQARKKAAGRVGAQREYTRSMKEEELGGGDSSWDCGVGVTGSSKLLGYLVFFFSCFSGVV